MKIKVAHLFVLLAILLSASSAFGQQSTGSLPGISLIWSRSVDGLVSVSLSGNASRLALLTDNGKLAVWAAQSGTSVWAASQQTGKQVNVSDGDGYVLCYNPLARSVRTVTLRRATTGAVIWKQTFDSAVWSAAFSPDGQWLAIGVGDDTVHLYNLPNKSSTSFSVIGTPMSIQFDPTQHRLYVGHWDRSGLSCYDVLGNNIWNLGGELDRTYVISDVGPKFLTYIGSSNRKGRSPVAYVVRTENGTLLWAYSFEADDESAFAQTTGTAEMTAISYAQPQKISAGLVTENRIAMIDRSGQMQWQKGGLFWSPTLICLTPDENGIVVYDGQRTLYRLDSQGRTVAKAFLSDVLRKWSVSADDSSLVVYTHDGQLSLLHIQ